MFTVECPRHQARVLLGAHSIEGLANTGRGVVLSWRCHCGTRGTMVTGLRRPVR
jgi:hypothetical protein